MIAKKKTLLSILLIVLFIVLIVLIKNYKEKEENNSSNSYNYYIFFQKYREESDDIKTEKKIGTIVKNGIKKIDDNLSEFVFANDSEKIYLIDSKMINSVFNNNVYKNIIECEIIYIETKINGNDIVFVVDLNEANRYYENQINVKKILLGTPETIDYKQQYYDSLEKKHKETDILIEDEEQIKLFLQKAESSIVYEKYPAERLKNGYYGNKTKLLTTIVLYYPDGRTQKISIDDLNLILIYDEKEKTYGIRTIDDLPLIYLDVYF